VPAYAKTTNKPGFGLSIQTFQAEEGILEIGCLLVKKRKSNKNTIPKLDKMSIDFLCKMPYTE
jgi:hypothetical protein